MKVFKDTDKNRVRIKDKGGSSRDFISVKNINI